MLTWAQNEPTGSLQKARGQRYDDAERNILLGLADHDLADAFRKLHGYETPAESWAAVYRGRRYPRRLDHVLAAKSLGITAVRYVNEWQHSTADRAALSDHAGMITDFEPTSAGLRPERSLADSADDQLPDSYQTRTTFDLETSQLVHRAQT